MSRPIKPSSSEHSSPSRPCALITGASAGLGAEFARQLASADIDLVLVARREAPMAELANEIADTSKVRVDILPADLSDPATPKRLSEQLQADQRRVSYLINNAGAGGPDLIECRDWAVHRAYMELMMTSVTALCHEFLPGMQEQKFGRILNVASVAGRLARGGDNTYGPAKAYVIALSEALAESFRSEGIQVTALCPGFTHTDFHQSTELAAMKDATPKFIWYDAEVVVREGLQALERGKPVYTSGRLYRLLDPLLQSVWTRGLLRKVGSKRGQKKGSG